MVSGFCQKSSAISKQMCHCFKNVWSYRAPNIAWGLINFHPYKMVMVQAINVQDVNRKTLCEFLLNAVDYNVLDHFRMMDVANFHVCGNVDSQNCPYWATENPHDIHQKALHSEKFIVWCCVASFGVTDPYFFENEAGRAGTVNSACYTEMLRPFLEPELQSLGVETETLWF